MHNSTFRLRTGFYALKLSWFCFHHCESRQSQSGRMMQVAKWISKAQWFNRHEGLSNSLWFRFQTKALFTRQSHILLWKKNVPGCHQQKRGLCSGCFFSLSVFFYHLPSLVEVYRSILAAWESVARLQSMSTDCFLSNDYSALCRKCALQSTKQFHHSMCHRFYRWPAQTHQLFWGLYRVSVFVFYIFYLLLFLLIFFK